MSISLTKFIISALKLALKVFFQYKYSELALADLKTLIVVLTTDVSMIGSGFV